MCIRDRHIARPHAGKLIAVAHHDQAAAERKRPQHGFEKQNIHHGKLVENEGIAILSLIHIFILNIDADHLDYFGTIDNIIRSFHQFALQTTGILLVYGDDPNVKKAMEGVTNARIVTLDVYKRQPPYTWEGENEQTCALS